MKPTLILSALFYQVKGTDGDDKFVLKVRLMGMAAS